MASKKKHPHKCKNHPKVIAKARCIKCGSWICNECTEIQKGLHFCKSHSLAGEQHPAKADQKILQKHSPASEPAPPLTTVTTARAVMPRSLHRPIITMAAVTFCLCCIVFALWAIREIRTLRIENASLRQKRIHLISLLKESNKEIGELKNQLTCADTAGIDRSIPLSTGTNSAMSVPVPQMPVITPEGLPLTFNNGVKDKPVVALTFDGSSFANTAGDILDTLRTRNVKATMFLTGEFISKFPDVTRRIVGEGHEAGNHTMKHRHFTTFSVDRTQTLLPGITYAIIANQLQTTESLFRQVTGTGLSPFWRAPYGEYNNIICKWALSCGYLHVGWKQGRSWKQSLDSNDWIPDEETPGYKSPDQVFRKIIAISRTKPDGVNGGIILMHLGTARARKEAQVVTILGALIDTLRSEGYSFVTVTGMLRESGVDLTKLPERQTDKQIVTK